MVCGDWAESEPDNLLLKTSELETIQSPSRYDYVQFENWFEDTKPFPMREHQIILRKDDFISLTSSRRVSFLSKFMKKMVVKLALRFPNVRLSHLRQTLECRTALTTI